MFRVVLVSLFAACCLGDTETILNDQDEKIVGGRPARIESYPYQVSLRFNGKHECGGSLIDKKWVLTAANCIKTVFPIVHLGTTSSRHKGYAHTVKNQYVHRNYTKKPVDYDLALLELTKPVTLSNKIKLINLADAGEELPEGSVLTVTGWGDVSSDGRPSLILRALQVPVLSQAVCTTVYRALTDRMFCAGHLGIEGKDVCYKDSGNPAVLDGVQYGVVSAGGGCGAPGRPGIYSKISNQREWIKRISGV